MTIDRARELLYHELQSGNPNLWIVVGQNIHDRGITPFYLQTVYYEDDHNSFEGPVYNFSRTISEGDLFLLAIRAYQDAMNGLLLNQLYLRGGNRVLSCESRALPANGTWPAASNPRS